MFLRFKSKRHQHILSECISALQKEIRRGNVDAVMYWTSELDLTGYGNWVWKRLKIIVSEDIGMLMPLSPTRVGAMYDRWSLLLRTAKKKHSESASHAEARRILVSTACHLASMPKSRLLNNALVVASEKIENGETYVPIELPLNLGPLPKADKRLRYLTAQLIARMIAKDVEQCAFLIRWLVTAIPSEKRDESSPIDLDCDKNLSYVWNAIEATCNVVCLEQSKYAVKALRKWFLADGRSPLWLLDAAAIVCKKPEIGPLLKPLPVTLLLEAKVDAAYDLLRERREIPDYAKDKHTASGKAMGRGIQHFFEKASKATNSQPDPFRDRAMAYYCKLEKEKGTKAAKSKTVRKRMRKRGTIPEGLEPPPPRKRKRTSPPDPKLKLKFRGEVVQVKRNIEEYLHDDVLAQMPCGSKPMARLGIIELQKGSTKRWGVFVKGPLTRKQVAIQVGLDMAKTRLWGLNRIGSLLWDGPDGFYVVMKDIGGGPYPYLSEMKETRRYGNRRIATSHKTCCVMVSQYLQWTGAHGKPSNSFMEQYIAILIFRKVFGVSDTNNRNIVVKFQSVANTATDEVYSVDETNMLWKMDNPSLFSRSVKKEVVGWVEKWIDPTGPHGNFVEELFKRWAPIFNEPDPTGAFAAGKKDEIRQHFARVAIWWKQGKLCAYDSK